MTDRSRRPDATEFAPYYQKYVELVPDGDVVATLTHQAEDTHALFRSVPGDLLGRGYAPGKWTLRQVLGHVMDAERIFAYRALRIGREDTTPLPSFAEGPYAVAGGFDDRPIGSLLAEFAAVRQATTTLLRGLPDEAWTRMGTASDYPVSVRGVAWIIAGHELHHMAIVRERYLGAPSVI